MLRVPVRRRDERLKPITAPTTTPMQIEIAKECVAAPIATPQPMPTAIQVATVLLFTDFPQFCAPYT